MTLGCQLRQLGLSLLVLLALSPLYTLSAYATSLQNGHVAEPIPVWILNTDSFEFWRDSHGNARGFYSELLKAINERYGYNLVLESVNGTTYYQHFRNNNHGLYASVLGTRDNVEHKILSTRIFENEVVVASITRQANNLTALQNARVLFRRHDQTITQLQERYPNLKFKQINWVDSSKEALQILRSGGADFYINEDREIDNPLYYYQLSRPFGKLRTYASFAITPDLNYMRNSINQLINEWHKNGNLKVLQEKSQIEYLQGYLNVTDKERSWLRDHKLTVWLPKNESFSPIIWKDEEGYHGGAISMINNLRDLLGVNVDVQFVDNYLARMQNESWPIRLVRIIDSRQDENIDGLIGPLMSWHNAYYNKMEANFILDEEQVRYQRVGVIRGAFASYYLRQRFGTEITIVARSNINELLDAIDNNEIDFILGDLSSLEQALRGNDLFRDTLKVAGLTHSSYQIGTWMDPKHPLYNLFTQVHMISSYRHQITPSENFSATNISKNTLQVISFSLLIILIFILSLMVLMWRHMRKNQAITRSIVEAMEKVNLVHDDETGCHIRRVASYCSLLARTLKLPIKTINDIENYASLHDIGKIAVPEHILRKKGKLTDEEFNEIKQHTVKGWRIVQGLVLGKIAENLIHYHHEKWDGSGYPNGLAGENIPLEARIMAIADVYDALRQKRVYKPGFSHEQAYEIIVSGSGSHFDPQLIKIFIQLHLKFAEIYDSQTEELRAE